MKARKVETVETITHEDGSVTTRKTTRWENGSDGDDPEFPSDAFDAMDSAFDKMNDAFVAFRKYMKD